MPIIKRGYKPRFRRKAFWPIIEGKYFQSKYDLCKTDRETTKNNRYRRRRRWRWDFCSWSKSGSGWLRWRAGGTAISWHSVDELEFPILLTVGKGGSGGVGGNEPQSGQSSSFGRYLSASSGARAASGTAFNYGENRLLSNGGSGIGYGGNHMNVRGSAGTPAITLSSGYESGGGGASFFCGGGNPIAAGSSLSGDPGAFGSGGGGAFSVSNSSAQNGGGGGDGIIIIEEYA
ncbi:hypothetical protein GC087_24955 (plasmid) [Pantoea sp. JZ2]|uniref:glycine-rich domain-containing protein n=1 Tax=Pantoea sp. JZ2 TaxID=2654189 RepID=UPI002B46B5CF|nr:hypothetical protein [Pantoea sp. JZ2]WRH15832.1 hypothetical protein GC087_24955 [Pantoea sp. JZ2]